VLLHCHNLSGCNGIVWLVAKLVTADLRRFPQARPGGGSHLRVVSMHANESRATGAGTDRSDV